MAGQRELKAKNPWHRPLIILITLLIIAGIVALVTIGVVQNKPLHQKYKYGIVLDAGSSHTSLYIYEWPAEKENNTGMVRQKHTCNVKGAGISSYKSNVSQAGASLAKCMMEAEDKIPASRHLETPVYLGATAGMRLLRMENETASAQVLASVESFLQGLTFSYQGARIITGQEEGAYGWITVNYLSDNFIKGWPTMGALDLGGASTQITFASRLRGDSEDFLHFRLYGKDYHVYTHSFLCYGKDQALKQALSQQLREGDNVLWDPCFHPGYLKNYSMERSPCVSQRKLQNFTHEGTGNWAQCQRNVLKIFNFSICSSGSCSFNSVYQPPLEGKFGAFSAFFFVMNFLNLTSETLEKTKENLASYCSTPWAEITKMYPGVKKKYLSEYCFSATYILTLLENGYNFTSDSWRDIQFIKEIGESDAGWTLGYMLNMTNMIPAEAPDTPLLPHSSYVTLMVFLALLLAALLFLAYRCFSQPRCTSQKQII